MEQPDVLRSRAQALLDLGRGVEAERLLGQYLASYPDDARAFCMLALAMDDQDRSQEMLEAANRAVALDPDEEWGHRLASIALVRLGMRDEAVRAAAEAVRLDPHSSLPHLQYALAAHAVPRLAQDAHAAALRAAELAPDSADVHYTLGLTSDATGRFGEVEKHYRDAIRLNPSHSAALNNLTVRQSNLRLGRKARGYLAALRANPDADYARANLEGLVGHFALRVLAMAGVALVACATIGSTHDLDPGFSAGRLVVGLLLVACVSAYFLVLVRQLPPGARTHLASRVRRDGSLMLACVLTVLGVAAALGTSFLPAGGALAVGLMRPAAFLVVATVVRVAVRRAR